MTFPSGVIGAAKNVEGKRPLRFRRLLDKWMHMTAIVFFGFTAGIVFLHIGMLWVQYMNGRSHRSTLGEFYVTQDSVSYFRIPATEQCRDGHLQQNQRQLVVNTSMYFW